MGSLCTCAFLAGLVFVLFAKTIIYLDNDPQTLTINTGIEYSHYALDTEFDNHNLALGLIYKAEF